MNQIRLFLCSFFSSKIDQMELVRKNASLSIALTLMFEDYLYVAKAAVILIYYSFPFQSIYLFFYI